MADTRKPTDQSLPQPEQKRSVEDELALLRRTVSDLAIEVAQLSHKMGEDAAAPRRLKSRSSRRAASGGSASRSSRRSKDRESDREIADTVRDVSDRSADELHKLVRGTTLAYVEQLRTYADAANEFVDEVLDRNIPDERESVRHLATSLPSDIYSGYVRAYDRALDAPSRMLDRFHESYDEADEIDDTDTTSRRSARRDRVDDRHENASASSHSNV